QGRLPGPRRASLRDQPEHRPQPEVPLLRHGQAELRRRLRHHAELRLLDHGAPAYAEPAAGADLQFRGSAAAASASASAAASAATSGDADVPGRVGDPGDRGLPAASATATAAAGRARTVTNASFVPTGTASPGEVRFARASFCR